MTEERYKELCGITLNNNESNVYEGLKFFVNEYITSEPQLLIKILDSIFVSKDIESIKKLIEIHWDTLYVSEGKYKIIDNPDFNKSDNNVIIINIRTVENYNRMYTFESSDNSFNSERIYELSQSTLYSPIFDMYGLSFNGKIYLDNEKMENNSYHKFIMSYEPNYGFDVEKQESNLWRWFYCSFAEYLDKMYDTSYGV